jgi:hypothetical protein
MHPKMFQLITTILLIIVQSAKDTSVIVMFVSILLHAPLVRLSILLMKLQDAHFALTIFPIVLFVLVSTIVHHVPIIILLIMVNVSNASPPFPTVSLAQV